jgi:hypothetical protein
VAIREKIRRNAQRFLQQGEVIQAVIPAQTSLPGCLSGATLVFSKSFRVIVVTDRRILVCMAGRFSRTKISEVLEEHPRWIKIGPPSGLWYETGTLGETMYVSVRFHKDVEIADAAAPPVP